MTTIEIIDLLLKLFEVNAYVEDGQLKIANALKYDIHNLLQELAPNELKLLYDELEYDPEEE
jgi:hypothetical protein